MISKSSATRARMDALVLVEAQGGSTYDELLAIGRAAANLGYAGLHRSDHLVDLEGHEELDATPAWITLAGLARDLSSMRLGSLVSPVTFYHPARLAKAVATVDAMSGGRVELGLGAGWFEREHALFGAPFPPLRVRLEMLQEFILIIKQAWSSGLVTFAGKHYFLDGVPVRPVPLQAGGPAIILGGVGRRRLPELVARHAAEYNAPPPLGIAESVQQFRAVENACLRVGRDPATVTLSWMGPVLIGTDRRDLSRKAARLVEQQQLGLIGPHALMGVHHSPRDLIATFRTRDMPCGTVAEVAAQLGRLRAGGARRAYLQVFPVTEMDDLALFVEAVGRASHAA